jgi:two-component system, CitB family, sensor kinase
MRLQSRIILATLTLIVVVVSLTTGLFVYVLNTSLRDRLGENALDVARTVARMPQIRDAFHTPDPAAVIQPLAEQVRLATGASYVVVGDHEGIRYSHPDPERIGLPMVGGDNAPALVGGKEYVSEAIGSLGASMRGKAPIFDDQEQIIGVVSVGFLLPEVEHIFWGYAPTVALILLAGSALGIPGAIFFARSIKKATHGLEPAEIASLAERQSAILGAIREGIIAIDRRGRVVVANETAREMLPGVLPGVEVLEVLPNSRLPEVLGTGEPEFDQRMLIHDTLVVTNRVPVRIDGTVVGVVASFRDQTELDRLARELSDARRYSEALRAQGHEFANILQAVSGLLQLDRVDEAVDFIQDVTDEHRRLVEWLPRSVGDPAVVALLLGKRARAEEIQCQFVVDPGTSPGRTLADPTLMVKVVGSLVDNAFEAVQGVPVGRRQVRVRLGDDDGQIRLEVADSGPGVPPEVAGRIFTEGFSTKGPGRGVGLALVRRLVERAGGTVTVGRAQEGGALFLVMLPLSREVS